MTTPARPIAALANLAIASGCSRAAFTGIFGADIGLSEYRGWTLAFARDAWTAKRGSRSLRSLTLGGIHGAVDKATRKRSPTGEAYARSTAGMV